MPVHRSNPWAIADGNHRHRRSLPPPDVVVPKVAIAAKETKKPPDSCFSVEATVSELRTGGLDGLGNIELLEVFDELASQLPGRLVVGARVSPGVARVEQLGIDAGHSGRHVQVDDRQMLGLGTDQRTILDRRDHRTGGRNAETLADAVAAAGPAGVDQVDLGTERLDALDQQLGVDTGRTREEWCAE